MSTPTEAGLNAGAEAAESVVEHGGFEDREDAATKAIRSLRRSGEEHWDDEDWGRFEAAAERAVERRLDELLADWEDEAREKIEEAKRLVDGLERSLVKAHRELERGGLDVHDLIRYLEDAAVDAESVQDLVDEVHGDVWTEFEDRLEV